MAEPTPATLAALRDLHPAASTPAVPAITGAPVTVTLEMLRNVLKALPRGHSLEAYHSDKWNGKSRSKATSTSFASTITFCAY